MENLENGGAATTAKDGGDNGDQMQQQSGEQQEQSVTPIPITDEDRKRIPDIPEKFKNWDDLMKWGSEAEKKMSQTVTEKDRLLQQKEEQDAIIAQMTEELQQAKNEGSITEEQRQNELERRKEQFFADPDSYIDRKIAEKELEIKRTNQIESMKQSWAQEENELVKKYGDKWTTEIRPEIVKIVKEKPYLTSIKDAVAIYRMRQQENEELNKQDKDIKRKDKIENTTETGGGSPAATKSTLDLIASAKSVEELEALKRKLK